MEASECAFKCSTLNAHSNAFAFVNKPGRSDVTCNTTDPISKQHCERYEVAMNFSNEVTISV